MVYVAPAPAKSNKGHNNKWVKMHRLIAISVLTFWAVMFGGLAHLSLAGNLYGTAGSASELQLLFSTLCSFQIMFVVLIIIAVMFAWAILALTVSDHTAFREVESYAYSGAIFMMSACAILAFVNLGTASTTPGILVAALVTSVAASRQLGVAAEQEPQIDYGREIARRMALGAAHNSLLSRVSGRPLPGGSIRRNNVTPFPSNPATGGQS